MNGEDWIPANKNSCDYIYEDEMKRLIIIVDELAELTQRSGGKSEEDKEKNAYKDEIVSILTSIAQLGRSAGIHVLLATQKPGADTVPTILRSNLNFRTFMGKAAEAGASKVALDNSLATLIEPDPPGMGVVQSAGVPRFFRSYYSTFEGLQEYYKQRGLDENGYGPIKEEEVEEDLEGEIEIEIDENELVIEFEGNKAEIDQRKDQDWTEI